jgi:hypothetical protein
MSRIPHCLHNRLTDGDRALLPQKHYFSASGTHLCYRLSELQGLVRPEGLGKLEKSIHLIGSGTSDLPARKLPRAPQTRPLS